MTGPVATTASGQVQIGNLTLDGSIGKVEIEGALGSYRDPRGDEHPSIGVNAGGSIMTTTATIGTPDNNARIGSGIGMGLGMNSTITDVDNDGIPERNIDFSLGPISLGWTTEDILSVISPERYQELQRQAEQAVAVEMGPSRFLNVWGAHQLHTQHMKRLVEAEVKRVNNKR